ncbi:MAG: phosphoglycerate mutase (2,3-diphosphoglycerate-independent) [Candidatus Pacebacteria bacterium RIFOXYB1_FULL_39_46]|nr:MAG: phosphoglycerate mutase (2,3-diphosphoglycerate-independent) [Candidatus Pacebacteria bacterium RIFOXYB1_FULL_39_46]OGJ39159.1 MAG: phosphoglycerate mutase (2,3-diphosphoglycerate-independent) [Candidatus Pacebacteria bacterium RIFOXYA1_FULL_38_18]OGJ40228.1 MAG: phosphoglycerate mutase (2,3-diphosphoglycerate-independent) [Candidatus Pacebacteria bacterium RIFOXYD1_FULL_39_27]OGJ41095.1 MAG: phosphoglycerate mutase (2,3-diphosphoglycerate-independent) [Candidatus Pacebacteria bacterium 
MPFAPNTPAHSGKKPVVLLILDGWGLAPADAGNAVTLANTPHMDRLWNEYPHTQLGASGEHVGLPKGVDGNSETGHMNIGAGRVVWQSLSRIDRSIEDGSFFQTLVFLEAIEHARKNNAKLHLIGLVSPGLVHSSVQHLIALLHLAEQQQFDNVFVHAFTDGRDAPPTASLPVLQAVEQEMQRLNVGKLASITGRFYAMDRDHNWERTQQAFEVLTVGKGVTTTDWQKALRDSYEQKDTDEFVKPIVILGPDGRPTIIEDHDAVIFFNFRVDRPRQLTWAFVLPDFETRNLTGSSSNQFVKAPSATTDQSDQLTSQSANQALPINFRRVKVPQNLYFATMSDYDKDLTNPKAFANEDISDNLGQVLSKSGVRQLRLTETEKEKMVTYYIDGKEEEPFPGEHWLIVPSKKVKTYAEAPEMSAVEITDELVREIGSDGFDVAIVNLVNGDMVGHTGDIQAGVKACEVVDQQVGRIVEAILQTEGVLLITADHGNVEEMINRQTGKIDTKHSTAPVPLIVVGKEFTGKQIELPTGKLADLAPTVLKLMHLSQPAKMTGESLI